MSGIDYKIKKYTDKLQSAKYGSQADFYRQKINYYRNQQTGGSKMVQSGGDEISLSKYYKDIQAVMKHLQQFVIALNVVNKYCTAIPARKQKMKENLDNACGPIATAIKELGPLVDKVFNVKENEIKGGQAVLGSKNTVLIAVPDDKPKKIE